MAKQSQLSKSSKQVQVLAVTRLSLILAASAAVTMLVGSVLAWTGYSYATGMVQTELAAQKIYFPPRGSAALSPDEFPGLQQYGGQLVDSGPEAKAYANEFIGAHLKKVAGGKVYAEVSAEAMKDPTNTTLQKQKATLFQGETLRGMLLGNGYGYWLMGTIAKYAAVVLALGGIVMTLVSVRLLGKLR